MFVEDGRPVMVQAGVKTFRGHAYILLLAFGASYEIDKVVRRACEVVSYGIGHFCFS